MAMLDPDGVRTVGEHVVASRDEAIEDEVERLGVAVAIVRPASQTVVEVGDVGMLDAATDGRGKGSARAHGTGAVRGIG